MNNLRKIVAVLPKSNLINTMQTVRNLSKNLPSVVNETENVKETCKTDPKNVHVIFGGETKKTAVNGTLLEKLQEKVRTRPECISKPLLEPEVEACPEEPVVEEKPPSCVAQPPEPECAAGHICGDTARRDIFKQVVNDSIFKNRETKCVPTPVESAKPPRKSPKISTKIDQTLSKILTSVIFSFIAYYTWLYGNLNHLPGNDFGLAGVSSIPSVATSNSEPEEKDGSEVEG